MNINKVILMGRMTSDPELKNTPNGKTVTQFSVAVNRKYSKDNQADFIECVAFEKTAEFIAQYMRKGSAIIICGRLQVDSWKDKEGASRKTTRVMVDEVQFGEAKGKTESPKESLDLNASSFFEACPDTDLPF